MMYPHDILSHIRYGVGTMQQRLDYRVATLEEMRAYHETRIGLLELLVVRMDERLAATERKADAAQRLWVREARKNGWLEDEELGEQ